MSGEDWLHLAQFAYTTMPPLSEAEQEYRRLKELHKNDPEITRIFREVDDIAERKGLFDYQKLAIARMCIDDLARSYCPATANLQEMKEMLDRINLAFNPPRRCGKPKEIFDRHTTKQERKALAKKLGKK